MRKIKFRAWDKDNKEMFEPPIQLNDSVYKMIIVDVQEDKTHFAKIENAEIMQYTGLKDKNGKEIYEGDIITFEDMGEEGYEYIEGFDFVNRASVVFENGRWELDNLASHNSSVLEEMNSCHEDFITVFENCEVIGNVHQNPELLEASNGRNK